MDVVYAFVLICLGTSLAFWVIDNTSLYKSLGIGFEFFLFGAAFLYVAAIEFVLNNLNIKNKVVRLLSFIGFSFIITISLIKVLR